MRPFLNSLLPFLISLVILYSPSPNNQGSSLMPMETTETELYPRNCLHIAPQTVPTCCCWRLNQSTNKDILQKSKKLLSPVENILCLPDIPWVLSVRSLLLQPVLGRPDAHLRSFTHTNEWASVPALKRVLFSPYLGDKEVKTLRG